MAPIIVRTTEIADSPLTASARTRAGRDEVDERAEERLALVLGVVLAGRRFRDLQETRAPQLKAAALEASDDLAGEAAAHAVRLDEDESGFAGHAAAKPSCPARASAGPAMSSSDGQRRRRARSPWRSTGRPATTTRAADRRTDTPAGVSSCTPGTTRYDASTFARQTGQRWSSCESRSSIALISSSRSRASWMYSGGRKNM